MAEFDKEAALLRNREERRAFMETIYRCCCGLDVHAKTVVACLIRSGKKTIKTFSTMTEDLLALLDWLVENKCTHVAIESTGIYWRPVFNVLESSMNVILVNARHIKAVPGRKTDVRDSEWIADLLRHGLLKPSFIPPREIRELRELTRYRQTLTSEQARIANRVQKVIESGNIKLGQVASDALGASGLKILHRLASGETDAEKMTSLAHSRLQKKKGELRRALVGTLTEAQRWVLTELLERYEHLESAIDRVNERIDKELSECKDPFVKQAVEIVDEIPGIGELTAQQIIAEIGIDMSLFPSERHISSWAGISPGNDESAGKRRSGKITKGNKYLRSALVQASWAASHTKKSYLGAQYQRLIRRLGKKKALVAVAHSILVMIYHMLSRRTGFHDLGADYFDRRDKDRISKRLIRKLQSLGLKVTTEPLAA